MAGQQAGLINIPLSDSEKVYRRVLPSHFKREADGTLRLSSQAFADRGMQPSVDRAQLCAPSFTQQEPNNAVVSVVVGLVREEDFTQFDAKKQPVKQFRADVIPDPLHDNHAHCLIRLRPDQASDRVFRKLLERLIKISKPEIVPASQ